MTLTFEMYELIDQYAMGCFGFYLEEIESFGEDVEGIIYQLYAIREGWA